MDTNSQDKASNNLATTENKLWLPPSYTNNEVSVAPAPKKRGINWGFADRTVFEWMMLVSQVLGAIAIPFVVTFLGLYATQQITQQQAQLSNAATEKQHQTDIQIANDQQQETTLENYLDRMSDLLLNNGLEQSKLGDEVRNVARARTLAVLRRLDGNRKGLLVLFLYQAHLINIPASASDNKNPVISLTSADLSSVDLNLSRAFHSRIDILFEELSNFSSGCGAGLRGIDLSGTNLSQANFFCADLYGADLHGANLFEANLQGDLSNANLSGANLNRTNLIGANLNQANLSGAYFCDVFLRFDGQKNCVYLSGANLSRANLSGISFKDVDLSDVNLSKAIISSEQLAQAKSLEGATMPDGSKHP